MARAKINSEMATRCELALMGKVVPCSTSEVQKMTEYIFSAIGKDPKSLADNIVASSIQKYSKTNEVKYITTYRVYDMSCICFLLESTSDDEEETYPAPFEEDYGTGCPCAFCYVLNADCDWCSEFGDVFFQKRADGFYHKVS